MDVLEEKEEEEQREEEELKALEISDNLQDLEMKVSVEQVCIPSDVPSIDTSQLPSSYKTNSLNEEKLLRIADHFLQQYTHLCPDRKPLFLHPVNECGVEKFVSTTVRPTLLPYAELYHWDGCASFVSDYLTMEPLKSPITPPSSLYSPTTILKYQRGNCFDFSVLLCSMLIGAGYDAYCVHGYATHEMCTLDETLKLCPLLRKPQEEPKERMKKSNKYRVKPPPDLQSKFELQQEAKKAETEAAEKNKGKEVEKVTEVEKPERDPLHGLRVHAWVLVLSGKKEVPETFFINPFTGNSHSTMDEHFLGIESVWNHRNYWVNMQDCRNGCKDLIFDLGDTIHWEVMLSGSNKPLQLLSDAEEEKELSDRDSDDMQEKEEGDRSFDMPPSWVAPIQISPREFETRCSEGRKVILYKKAKLEKWAPYLNGNGLVKRLTIYADLGCTEVAEVREWFKNREDRLEMREVNKQTQLTTDYFSPGHLLCLKAHTYTSLQPETEYTMEFYNEARVDGLQKRVETPNEMTEYFVGRDDFLHVRYMEFGKRRKKIHLAGTRTDINSRPIVQIKECFHRNPEKPADEDVAERVFLITKDMIQLTYHLKDNYITASKKDFFKAAEGDRKGNEMVMTPEMCITYKAGSSEKEEKLLHLYKLLQKLTVEEKQLKLQVQQSEAEVLNILKVRENEETNIKLSVSIYNVEKNEKRRQQYEAMKKTREDDLRGPGEQDLDYLAPFLIQIGHKEKMTKERALRVRDDCLTDFKNRLINKANIIQARLEKAVEELQKKDQWFQKNQNRLSAEEESDFLTRRSETTFHIQILALRLKREKQAAPQKYLALEEKLRNDPRLAEHLDHT
ncbi:PREDICTED: dynein regulatory complex subunit 7 isoform X1 [Calidris pugnax]|uniref:dynein regulatory complex subunit 7 isoform X1 n=1 Tax=Calidris pugnax TaxID=198806 RepID=UPI00071D704A|nr:PREDICTED: dynein regulatory complex subunit 7 isoform X1 [Calidris pugnax]XP_014802633.1 PREDICTED: dynein regulatory complex subunit 7 isoform X1 [Calidris pugnax]XP_014802642.1 PREDICTED: dynein regulatory complex subunit 7 isoform X1 [Calidris pugnax]XP_014802651.1 PREDICTED: dynein regulatory complex subunit 7 isoform X1 [Calidris pugnax]